MPRILGLMTIGLFVCIHPTVAAAPVTDPIQAKINKALETYTMEMENLREKAGSWFEAREKIARREGDKKLIDQVHREKRVFRTVGDLPAMARDMRLMQAATKEKLVRVYAAAVKDWTKAGNDEAAAAADAELQKIKAWLDPSMTCREWEREKRGGYWMVGKGVWEEIAPDGRKVRWKEVDRTSDYVELDGPIGNRRFFVRLWADRAEYSSLSKTDFESQANGKWVK